MIGPGELHLQATRASGDEHSDDKALELKCLHPSYTPPAYLQTRRRRRSKRSSEPGGVEPWHSVGEKRRRKKKEEEKQRWRAQDPVSISQAPH